jgi:1,4-alpha-glucan branching enzyme
MRQDTKGNWTAELLLRPGEYEYRFLVDGQWKDDPMAKRYVGNSFGGFNCILEVKPFAANLSVKRAEPRAATATT